MKYCDRDAISRLRIPALALMENAGRGVVDALFKHYGHPGGKQVVVFCGKGNNGGDGFVAARHLLNLKAMVTVVCLSDPADIRGDARRNYEALKNIGRRLRDDNRLRFVRWSSAKSSAMLPEPTIIIDALLGTGAKGKVIGPYKSAIEWMNRSPAIRVAVDIPSGLNADNGTIETISVNAALTATMGFKKIGLILNKGIDYSGLIEVIDISIPEQLSENVEGTIRILEPADIRSCLPRRSSQAHKHAVGKVLIVSGSRGFTGAAYLSSMAAMRSGAGSVILCAPASIQPVLARKLSEVIVVGLPETPSGALDLNAIGPIKERMGWADVLVIGPGLTTEPETVKLVRKVVSGCPIPFILDADGLNAFSSDPDLLSQRGDAECTLTPHIGELSKLIGVSAIEIGRERVQIAKWVASKFNTTLVLKGAPTIIATADGTLFLNSTGNPGMATAGSGDVLAGMIGGFRAQGTEMVHSAWAGVFLHGMAGDRAKSDFGERGMLASDIMDNIAIVSREIEGRAQV